MWFQCHRMQMHRWKHASIYEVCSRVGRALVVSSAVFTTRYLTEPSPGFPLGRRCCHFTFLLFSFLTSQTALQAASLAHLIMPDSSDSDDSLNETKARRVLRKYFLKTSKLHPRASIPPKPKKMKKQSPQDIVEEFWTKFNSKTPGKGEQSRDSGCHTL